MQWDTYRKIAEMANSASAREETIAYLAQYLMDFLLPGDRVLICFLGHREGGIGWLMEQAVLRCDMTPVVWGQDHRWKTLLRTAFANRVTAVIGPPLVILGLTKICKYKQIPLYVRKVITAGYPCLQWMMEGIRNGMDCDVSGCFSLDETGVVAGFACGQSFGVHLREKVYGIDVLDEKGNPVSDGVAGELILYPQSNPGLRLYLGDTARKEQTPCRCGSSSPRLLDMHPGRNIPSDLLDLGEYLQSWTSILDCRLKKGEYGLEMEIVYFQGEKLPKLPTAAKMVLRPWSPETDMPLPHDPVLEFLESC